MSLKQDSSGRQFMAIHETRSNIYTAAASVTNGTATSLIAADADYFTDIIEVTLSSNTTVAGVQVSLLQDGSVVRTVQVPQNSTLQLLFDAPLAAIRKNTVWAVDMEDISGTTVTVGARFIKSA